jgi:hypothetical protein
LGDLRELRDLFLDGNEVSDLPHELVGCAALHLIDLRGNPLAGLPQVLVKLKQLESVLIDPHDENLRSSQVFEALRAAGVVVGDDDQVYLQH